MSVPWLYQKLQSSFHNDSSTDEKWNRAPENRDGMEDCGDSDVEHYWY